MPRRRASITAYVSTATMAIIARVSTSRWLEISTDRFITSVIAELYILKDTRMDDVVSYLRYIFNMWL